MNNSKKPLQTREDKLKYLEGLKNGSRSLAKIILPTVIILSYRDDQPEIVTEQITKRTMTVAEAEILKAKVRVNNILLWEEHKTYLDPREDKPGHEINENIDNI